MFILFVRNFLTKDKKHSRKELELDQRRTYILDRAEELFAQRGFDNVSMAQIAEKSEFSIGSLYNFFPSKNDIFSEILCRKVKIMHDELSKINENVSDPLERIKESLRFNIKFFLSNREFVKLYYDDFERHEWGLPTRFQKNELTLINKTAQIAVSMMTDAQKKGLLSNSFAPEKLMIILRKLVIGFHVYYLQQDKLDDMHDAADDIMDIFLNGVGT